MIEERSANSPQNRILWFLVGSAILLAGIGGFVALKTSRVQPVIQPRLEKVPLVRTVPVQLSRGALSVVGNGVVRPETEIILSAQVAGEVMYVNPVLVSGGQFRKDDILIKLDQRSYKNSLAQTLAEKRSIQATLLFTEKQIKRNQALIKKGTVTEEVLDRFISQKEELMGNIAGLDAQIAQANLNIEHTTIKAPFSGRVRTEQVDIGEYVTPGQQLARIFTHNRAEITVELNDKEAQLIPDVWKVSDIANTKSIPAIIISRFGKHNYFWDGYVHRTEATIGENTRTVNLVIRVPEPLQPGRPEISDTSQDVITLTPPPLTPGMYVTVKIQGIYLDEYITVPRSAVKDNDTVWVVSGEETLKVVDVTVIQEVDEMVNIVSPELAEGMSIITSNLPAMTTGMKIRAISPGETTPGIDPDREVTVK